MKDFIREHEDGVLFDITVKPGSKAQGIRVSAKKGVVVSVTSLPVKNRANREIVRFLSDYLGLPVTIHRSMKNYHKTILVPGMAGNELRASLGLALSNDQ